MHALTFKVLSNLLIVDCIKCFLSKHDWVEFLLSLCNPVTGSQDSCELLGLNDHLLMLITPLCEGWQLDETTLILTI